MKEAEKTNWFEAVCEVAKRATCLRSKCGSIIVKDQTIIGEGWNSPPGNSEQQRRCLCSKEVLDRKVTDKTCCVHAETHAILDALRRNAKRVIGSTLYFVRLNEHHEFIPAGMPYCTICSKLALDVGITSFILWHEKGMKVYDTAEYNLLSYQYHNDDGSVSNV